MKQRKPKRSRGWMATKGNALNPLLSFPRNAKCFCGSGIKFKKCCVDKLHMAIPAKEASEVQAFVNNVKDHGLNKIR